MAQPWSLQSQLLILAVAFGLGGAALLARDQISDALASLQKAGQSEPEESNKRQSTSAPEDDANKVLPAVPIEASSAYCVAV